MSVESLDASASPNADAKAGLMLRTGTTSANATATGADMVGLYIAGDDDALFEYRSGGSTTSGGSETSQAPPRWLKLVKDGSTFSGYVSSDGSSWTKVGSDVTVTMSTAVP